MTMDQTVTTVTLDDDYRGPQELGLIARITSNRLGILLEMFQEGVLSGNRVSAVFMYLSEGEFMVTGRDKDLPDLPAWGKKLYTIPGAFGPDAERPGPA